jgi:hypothetical protein
MTCKDFKENNYLIIKVYFNFNVFVVLGIGFQHSITSIGRIVIIAFGMYLILSTKEIEFREKDD